jgi:hypothetical protein
MPARPLPLSRCLPAIEVRARRRCSGFDNFKRRRAVRPSAPSGRLKFLREAVKTEAGLSEPKQARVQQAADEAFRGQTGRECYPRTPRGRAIEALRQFTVEAPASGAASISPPYGQPRSSFRPFELSQRAVRQILSSACAQSEPAHVSGKQTGPGRFVFRPTIKNFGPPNVGTF